MTVASSGLEDTCPKTVIETLRGRSRTGGVQDPADRPGWSSASGPLGFPGPAGDIARSDLRQ